MTHAAWHVVLTGHSRGLGGALARALLAQGAAVLGVARQAQPGLAAVQASRLVEVALDLADPAAVQAWLATGELANWLAGASRAILVNNAGTVQPMGPVGGGHAGDHRTVHTGHDEPA